MLSRIPSILDMIVLAWSLRPEFLANVTMLPFGSPSILATVPRIYLVLVQFYSGLSLRSLFSLENVFKVRYVTPTMIEVGIPMDYM